MTAIFRYFFVENIIFELLSPNHKKKIVSSGLLVTNGRLVKTRAFSD